MLQAQMTLAFLYQTAGGTDKVVLLDKGFPFQLLLRKLVLVVLIGNPASAVEVFNEIAKIAGFQTAHLETAGDFVFQQFFHF